MFCRLPSKGRWSRCLQSDSGNSKGGETRQEACRAPARDGIDSHKHQASCQRPKRTGFHYHLWAAVAGAGPATPVECGAAALQRPQDSEALADADVVEVKVDKAGDLHHGGAW
jgi:hypothetical protein